MLDLAQPILEADIYYSKVLKQGENGAPAKVFMLNGYGGDRIVVKQESEQVSKGEIRQDAYFMSLVDSGAKVFPLGGGEVGELLKWAQANTPYPDLVPGAADLERSVVDSQKSKAPWIKMKAFRLIETDKAALKLGTGDKTDVRFIAAILNGPGGLEKLGQIIAVDFFIGNMDRFTFLDMNYGTDWPPRPIKPRDQLRCTANVGNVFVAVDPAQGGAMIGGQDYIDPNSMFRLGRTQSIPEIEKNSAGAWLGRLLGKGSSKERMEYCFAVIEDLNKILGPRNRKFAFACKDRLPPGSPNRLNRGIEIGAQKLRGALQGLRNLPASLSGRISLLGW